MNQAQFQWPGFDGNNQQHQVIQSYLILDVQYSSRHAERIYAAIEGYLDNPNRSYEGSGNGYEFACQPEGFYIDCLYEDDPQTPVTVPYKDFLVALEAWIAHCKELETRQ